jgi:TonB family protein
MFLAFLATAATTPPAATAIDPASWFSPDDYPLEAQIAGIEGQSGFEVDVDAQGRPTACRITSPSGSTALDKATCNIVLERGQFKPAMSHGHPVAGHYSQSAKWRLEGSLANGYAAVIIDFSKDPDHPSCSVVTRGFSAGSLCDGALKQFSSGHAATRPTKAIALISIATGSREPYRGEPGWGKRLSFTAIDLYSAKTRPKPACAVVAKEGAQPGANPCAAYSDAAALSDADKNSATKTRVERSIFLISSETPTVGKCKDGESEADSCI